MAAKKKTREEQVSAAIALLFDEAVRIEGEGRARMAEIFVLFGDLGALMVTVNAGNERARQAIAELKAGAAAAPLRSVAEILPDTALSDKLEEAERRRRSA